MLSYKFLTILQVRVDHMALALSNTFKSPIVDTIQSLPQHQQVSLSEQHADFTCSKTLRISVYIRD
jgi:hypothetical protein